MTSPVSVFEIYANQDLERKQCTQLFENIMEARLIADEKDFPRAKLFCISIERRRT